MNTLLKFLEPYEKKLVKKVERKGLIITVSGKAGTGKSTIARMIADEMELRYFYPPSIYREMSKEKGVVLEKLVENAERETDYEIEKKTFEEGLKGNVVIDSRLSGFIMGGFANFKIFVTCDTEKRIERVVERDGISKEEASERIKKRDEIDTTKYKRLYAIDMEDTSIYDMVFDNSGSLEDLQEKIKEIVNRINVFG